MDLKDFFNIDHKNKKVLLYGREPKLSGLLFRNFGDFIIKKHLKIDNYAILSDYEPNADYYLDLKKYSLKDYTSEDFKIVEEVLDIESIIKNERVFRLSMSYYDSCQLIYSAAKFLIELFRQHKYDILLTHTVDNYVVDILTRLAKYFNITVIAYCASSYGSKYIMISERGEYNLVREPSLEEVDNFVAFLEDSSAKPLVKTRKQVNSRVFKYYFIYKIKYIWHYLFQHKFLGKIDYRYLMTTAQIYPRSLKNIFGIDHFFIKSIKDIPPFSKEKAIYLPLHFHPEATTEYWVQNKDYLTYYPSLFKVIKNYLERGFTILVKEHTAMHMMRDKNIYKQLSSLKNVYLLSPYISTYEVLDYVEYTILWTGTTGVEAIMSDKKVILTETETYYSHNKLAYINNENTAKIFSKEDKRELAKRILGNLLKIE
ncbi:hypothetical protein [Emticicia agri]|uniref:Capsule polysaccharide biosynthesis protein n=1 Tax=Emticicia agri TaxID=2492393 RepID=A0A4Q5LTE2_9BACT|nr:hypothetical protein [Emticicia agri]RYU92896.1 hypothetical protein EWM59_24745 [Emticicia agri]